MKYVVLTVLLGILCAARAYAGVLGGPPQSIGYVQSNCGQVNAPGVNITVTLTNTPNENDVVVVFLENNGPVAGGADGYIAPTAFELLDSDLAGNNAHLNMQSFLLIVPPFQGNTFTFQPTDGTRQHVWCAAEYNGVSTATPSQIHGIKFSSAASTTWSSTTLFPETLPVVSVNFFGVTGTDSATWTNPPGTTQRAYNSKWSVQLIDNPGDGGNIDQFTSTASSSLAGPGDVDMVELRSPIGIVQTAEPVFRQGNCGVVDNPNPLVMSLVNPPVQGNVLVGFLENNANTTPITYTPATGVWTAIDSDANVNACCTGEYSYWHAVGAAEGGTYNFTPSSTTKHHVWCLAEYTNVNTTTPIDTHAIQFNAGPGTSWQSAALTATNQQELPISFWAPEQGGTPMATWSTEPNLYLQRVLAANGATQFTWSAQVLDGPFTTGAAQPIAQQTAITSASAAGPADVDTMLLSSSFIPPPTPGPTPTPGSTPTPIPTPPSSPYSYHGCAAWAKDDWFTTPLNVADTGGYVPTTVDTNSTAIITALNTAGGGSVKLTIASNPRFTINVASNGNPAPPSPYTMSSVTSLFANDTYNDDPNKQMPWSTSFLSESQIFDPNYCVSQDCHGIVLNTTTCVLYDFYGFGTRPVISGSNLTGPYSLEVSNLKHTINDQYNTFTPSCCGVTTASGIPYGPGTLDAGEDASLTSINHVVLVYWGSGTLGIKGNVPPANASPTGCGSCTNALPFGARLQLKESSLSGGSCNAAFSATAHPQANLVCHQLATYGMMLFDLGNYLQVDMGSTSGGTQVWSGSDVGLLTGLPITDFQVIKLCGGTIGGVCSGP